jgi:ATPase subunit of ABC transporter with duplicated ATPase domains
LKFEGTLLFVSHDHHFVAKLATRVIELGDRAPGDNRPGCNVVDFGGTYEEYQERSAQRVSA